VFEKSIRYGHGAQGPNQFYSYAMRDGRRLAGDGACRSTSGNRWACCLGWYSSRCWHRSSCFPVVGRGRSRRRWRNTRPGGSRASNRQTR